MASLTAQLQESLRRDAAVRFSRAVRITTDRLDATTPVKTGRLKRSRRTTFTTGGNVLSAQIDYSARSPGGADYGKMLDEGLRPHRITARSGGVLRFVVGGRVLFRRSVNWRPGARANSHRGWLSRPTSQADWRLTLNRVFGGG